MGRAVGMKELESMTEEEKNELVGSVVPHTRGKGKDEDLVMVSFRLPNHVKQEASHFAREHGRTQGKQFAQSHEDGMKLQPVIAKVSEHLTERMEVDGKTFIYKPDEDTCIEYIISAAELVMEQERRERNAAGEKPQP